MADGANEFGKKLFSLSCYISDSVRAAVCNTERQRVRRAKGSSKQTKFARTSRKFEAETSTLQLPISSNYSLAALVIYVHNLLDKKLIL